MTDRRNRAAGSGGVHGGTAAARAAKKRSAKLDPLDALPETLNAHELGRLMCVSSRLVYDLAKRGIVKRTDQPGRYLTRPSFDAYLDHLRATAADRGGPDGTPNLAHERIETEKVTRELAKLRLERELTEILRPAETSAVWSELVGKYRSGVIAARSKLDALFPNMDAHGRLIIGDVLVEVLEDLAQEMEGNLPPGATTHVVLDAATEAKLRAI
jgi:hypothetical protein